MTNRSPGPTTSPAAPRGRSALVRVAPAAFAALAAGCAETGWSTFEPASDLSRMILDPYGDLMWWTIGIFVVVEAMLLFALWRYRNREGDSGVPEQVHGHTFLEIGWTIAPAVILFFIAIPTIRTIFATQADPVEETEPSTAHPLLPGTMPRPDSQWWRAA